MSERLIFMRVVTQFQLALDMALSFGAPPGFGHAYYAQAAVKGDFHHPGAGW